LDWQVILTIFLLLRMFACGRFLIDKCPKSAEDCRFPHNRDLVPFCKDWANGLCDGSCWPYKRHYYLQNESIAYARPPRNQETPASKVPASKTTVSEQITKAKKKKTVTEVDMETEEVKEIEIETEYEITLINSESESDSELVDMRDNKRTVKLREENENGRALSESRAIDDRPNTDGERGFVVPDLRAQLRKRRRLNDSIVEKEKHQKSSGQAIGEEYFGLIKIKVDNSENARKTFVTEFFSTVESILNEEGSTSDLDLQITSFQLYLSIETLQKVAQKLFELAFLVETDQIDKLGKIIAKMKNIQVVQHKTNIATSSFRFLILEILENEIKSDNISNAFMSENLPSKMLLAENEKEVNQNYNMLEMRQKARMKSFARLIKNLYSNEFISSDEILDMIIELIRKQTDISFEFFCIILKIMLKNQNFVTEILNAEKAKIISEHLMNLIQSKKNSLRVQFMLNVVKKTFDNKTTIQTLGKTRNISVDSNITNEESEDCRSKIKPSWAPIDLDLPTTDHTLDPGVWILGSGSGFWVWVGSSGLASENQ